jgi:glycosyltransferase involved in cell wall biosynthesis
MLISVIIPCYNSEKFISDCIDSVLKQDYKNIEIILVDDGSTDGTNEILKKIVSANSEKIKLLTQKNCGASAARNAGLQIANGEYIQFLDSDDILLPEKITHQVSLLGKNNLPGFIAASFIRHEKEKMTIPVFSGDSWTALIRGKLGCTCSNLFNKKVIENAGGWKEAQKSSQESELMFRLLKNESSIIIDNLPLTEVRTSEVNSISNLAPLENLQRFFQLRIDIFNFLQDKKLLNGERENALSVILLGTLRMIYKKDKKMAVSLFKEKYRPSFKPVAGPGISKAFVLLLSVFGFDFCEKLFSILR